MKKILILLLCIISISASHWWIYTKGFSNGANSIEKNLPEEIEKAPLFNGKPDYPLIDIVFSEENEWLVVNRENLFTESEKISVIDNVQLLELNKEQIFVTTFPLGRGTTPNGEIYIYKDGELIKSISYFDFEILSDELKTASYSLTKEQIEEMIVDELPSPI